ncbi:MAG: hypothetical protein FWE91_12860 [Defluviitaleaceae bacterium]|nr:hypothetical protein [Defluviitaleaceae bacterium]MCL2836949.1 hypothetical protein [Defluviitaleaceae bacterium]
MILIIIVSSLLIMAAGAVFYRSMAALPFAYGVLMAMALNIGKVFMLENTVQKAHGLDPEEAKRVANIVRLQILGRFALTAAVLVVAGLAPFIDVLGAVFGIFTWQIAAYSMRFSKKIKE